MGIRFGTKEKQKEVVSQLIDLGVDFEVTGFVVSVMFKDWETLKKVSEFESVV